MTLALLCQFTAQHGSDVNTSTSGSACTRIPHHQQPIPLHNTNTPQDSTIQPTQ